MSAEGIRDGICTEANRPRFPTQEEPLLQVDTVRASDIAPEAFFDRYVKNRIPVKLVGSITDARWNGHAWLDLAYLDRKCGHCLVKVERRCERGAFQTDFGNGLEQQVCFSEFLNAIRSGDESYYLTTQQLGYSPEGEPGIVSAPLTELDGEFPWRPSLTGNLITQNINIWIGSSSKGTCSGLHHDHHDNLYILLNGEKSFKLFSPAELPNMYVHGSIARIHPNGRINYSGQLTRADGADVNSNRALRASMKLDQMACRVLNAVD